MHALRYARNGAPIYCQIVVINAEKIALNAVNRKRSMFVVSCVAESCCAAMNVSECMIATSNARHATKNARINVHTPSATNFAASYARYVWKAVREDVCTIVAPNAALKSVILCAVIDDARTYYHADINVAVCAAKNVCPSAETKSAMNIILISIRSRIFSNMLRSLLCMWNR
mmetsp:Transcript_9706/g.14806  ORF Transcript_9706/g.14806 Transcript_9706/m.14806 type:complete len:173 (+) Transcript_9706:997-1515(+)